MRESLVSGVRYERSSSNGSSYGIGYDKPLGSDGDSEIRSSSGRSGGEVSGKLEGSPLGGFSDGIPGGEVKGYLLGE